MRAVLAQAQAEGDTIAPWRALDPRAGGVDQHFDDEGDLLVELHREWLRVLIARLHRGEIVAQRTVANVRDLYDEVCRDHPTLRRILDTHRANPASPTEESLRLGVESGWYSTKVSGTFVSGPHSSEAECLRRIAEITPPPVAKRKG